jgi:hypothetical protein
MRNHTHVLGAITIAGLVAATGAAFTGTGLATSGSAGSAQFVGGTVSQAVTGATLTTIAYGYADSATKTAVNAITLTFANTEDGRSVAVAPSGGTGGTFTCGVTASNSSTCSFAPTTAETGYTGLNSLSVSVS